MGINLLTNAVAGTVGNKVDVHSIAAYRVSLRIDAIGGFTTDVVTIQESPDDGTTWIALGTLTSGAQLIVAAPVDTIRAVAGAAMVGTATVIAEIGG